jgi:hypothetical protein
LAAPSSKRRGRLKRERASDERSPRRRRFPAWRWLSRAGLRAPGTRILASVPSHSCRATRHRSDRTARSRRMRRDSDCRRASPSAGEERTELRTRRARARLRLQPGLEAAALVARQGRKWVARGRRRAQRRALARPGSAPSAGRGRCRTTRRSELPFRSRRRIARRRRAPFPAQKGPRCEEGTRSSALAGVRSASGRRGEPRRSGGHEPSSRQADSRSAAGRVEGEAGEAAQAAELEPRLAPEREPRLAGRGAVRTLGRRRGAPDCPSRM